MVDESATESPIDKQVGKNIERLRKAQSWSQSALARRMQAEGFEKFNQMSVSRTEKGERSISVRELMAFAEIFDVMIHELLNEPELSNLDHLLDRLVESHEELRSALDRVDRMRLEVAFAAEMTDWSDRRMPPFREAVVRYLEMSAPLLVQAFMSEREERERDEVKLPPALLKRRGVTPEDPVAPGTFPFVDAFNKANRGVDQEA